VTAAAGIFVLPFFMFSAVAGQIADKFEKSTLIRRVKLAEIPIMIGAAAAFHLGEPLLLITVLFLMGTQSAFFGPLKYAILPDHLREDELVAGNGLVEAGTFVAILTGTVIGGVLVLGANGVAMISSIVIALAVLGWLVSRMIPPAPATARDMSIDCNIVSGTWWAVRHVIGERKLLLAILGISWFWLIGATFLSQFPSLAKDVLGGDERVVTLLLTTFAVGIAAGSLWCNVLLKNEISAKYVPLAALAMTVFIVDFYLMIADRNGAGALVGAAAFLAAPGNWRILFDLFAVAVAGGLFSVPLYAILQSESARERRARNVAVNNILNALFMVVGAVLAGAMLAMGISVPGILLALAIANLAVAVYICRLLPHHLIRTVFAMILRPLFRVRVEGLDNYRQAGARAFIVANHVSFLDGILLAVFLPGRPVFAVDTHIAKEWWARPFLTLAKTFTVNPNNPFATKALVREVKAGNHLVIFPEGRITVTGALMKIHEGPGMIADKAEADLIPVRIAGAETSTLSRIKGKLRQRWFPGITITILEPRRFKIPRERWAGRVGGSPENSCTT